MAIHGNKSQNARVKALQDFKENRITALVATEVAARGLDIKELPHVVNYELPNVPEDYVHRIGRTARAGSTGAAVSLVSPDEVPLLRDIEKLLKRSVEFTPTPQFEIKEGTHTPRAESREAGEYQPHQDPRRRPQSRGPRGGSGGSGGRGARPGGNRHGGRAAPGRASHDAYADIGGGAPAVAADAPRAEGSGRSDGQRSGQPRDNGRRDDNRRHGGQHQQQGSRQGPGNSAGQPAQNGPRGKHRDAQPGRDARNGRGGQRGRGGFARGARSSGGSQGGHGGSSGGGFSRIK
jgi:ATP-dependent RNA helicase RhlE